MTEELQELIERYKAGSVSEVPRPARLPLSAITEMPRIFQPREGLNSIHAMELAKIVDRIGDLDPVTIMVVRGEYVLIDGHHRAEAYRRAAAERSDIPVQYFDGDPLAALIEVGTANGKVRLNLKPKERQDFAWRLVVSDLLTRPQIEAASGISRAQVTLMRKAKKVLGDAAANYEEWFRARHAANGKERQEFTDEDIALWKAQRAERIANELLEQFGMDLVRNTEVTAIAFATHFGRRLEDLVRELWHHLPKDFEADPVEDAF